MNTVSERSGAAGTSPGATPALPAFGPIHARALGVAVGVVSGLGVFGVTALHVALHSSPAIDIGLLAQYFPGYTVSWTGAIIGLGWGALVGYATGWFVAVVRNMVLAIRLFTVRTKAELAQTRNLLDDL